VKKHRLTIDIRDGRIEPETFEIVELVPGELHYREPTGDFRRVQDRPVLASELLVWTGFHDRLPEAAAVAAAELRRRGERLIHLAERCEQIEESTNV
jgi:hypothetical protein